MICPACGPDGKMEQTGFGPEYETFYCSTCKIDYIAYSTSSGLFTEPVPFTKRTSQKRKEES